MTRIMWALAAALLAAAMLGGAPRTVSAQRVLVYCPGSPDDEKCRDVYDALRQPLAGFSGVDLGYNGVLTVSTSTGPVTTINLSTTNLTTYKVLVVPSTVAYTQLTTPAVAANLRRALNGRVVVYAGDPDQQNNGSNADQTQLRAKQNRSLQNLARWAGGSHTGTQGTGLVVLKDFTSSDALNRYAWVEQVANLLPLGGSSVRVRFDGTGGPIDALTQIVSAAVNPTWSNELLKDGGTYTGTIFGYTGPFGNGALLEYAGIVQLGLGPVSGGSLPAGAIYATATRSGTTKPVLLAYNRTIVTDALGPVTSSVAANPASVTDATTDVVLSATVSDLTTGGLQITSAEFSTDNGTTWSATLMSAVAVAPEVVGVFDAPSENVTVTIPAAAVAGLGSGSRQLCVRGTDAAGNTGAKACASLSINIVPPNAAPQLAAIGNKTIDEGQALDVTASATDDGNPSGTLLYSLTVKPAGATIDESTGKISWTPGETEGGQTFNFTVRVTDGELPDSKSFTVTVVEVNAPPVWTTVGARSVNEETLLSFTVQASDSDLPANALTYSVLGTLPDGATFDPATRTFSWTPTEAQGPSSPAVTLRVNDGTVNVDESFTITVNEVNKPPVLAAISNRTINELTDLTGVTASATDPDLPPNTLTYSLTTKPVGMTINGTTGAISWRPEENQDGVHSVTVEVSDGKGGTDSKSFQVTVNEVNVAPTIAAITPVQVSEGSSVTFTAAATDPDIVGGVAQQGQLSFSLGTFPVGVTGSPAITTAGVFSWTPVDDNPTNTASDLYNFTVQVSDGATPVPGTDTETAAVTVKNVAPVIVPVGGVNVTVPTTPVGYPTAVTASVNFTDVGTADTHTNSSVQWDAGLPFEKNGTNGTTIAISGGVLTASKSLAAGIYTVTLKVVDDDTGEATATATTFVVVYDPNGGFTTGGGWFTSDADDCLASVCSGATGRAHFGFVSKYTPGRTTPTGNTEFQFQAGNLRFQSNSYEALVVSGNRAQYWGSGSVNGVAGYTFRLTAVDGQVVGNEGTVDKFRIEIWQGGSWQANQPMGGTRIYDNQWNESQEAQLTTAIEGGSITIKTK